MSDQLYIDAIGNSIRLKRHECVCVLEKDVCVELHSHCELVAWCLKRGKNLNISIGSNVSLFTANGYVILEQGQCCQFVLNGDEWRQFCRYDKFGCIHDFPDSHGFCDVCHPAKNVPA